LHLEKLKVMLLVWDTWRQATLLYLGYLAQQQLGTLAMDIQNAAGAT
jgi:hypothetical protein